MVLQLENWTSVEPGSRFISSLFPFPTVRMDFRFAYSILRGAIQLDHYFTVSYAEGL